MACGAWQQGALDASGNWTASGTGTDARTVCTSGTDGDTLEIGDLPASLPSGTVRIVIDASDAEVDYINLHNDEWENAEGGHYIVTGTLGGSSDRGVRYGIDAFKTGDEWGNFTLESRATVTVSGSWNHGVYLYNGDRNHSGRLEAVNKGTVSTGGQGGHGVYVYSLGEAVSYAEARAANEGSVTTSGDGATGVYAYVDTGAGTATAVNSGTVITTGDYRVASSYLSSADGVKAANEGGGNAAAINAAGGIVTVSGAASEGVYAYTEGGGTARAVNRGTVTATGDSATDSGSGFRSSANGVHAATWINGGVARAVNEAGAIITTGSKSGMVRSGGKSAVGLSAHNEGHGGRAEAINRGAVTTYGDPQTGWSLGAHGVSAWSEHNSAYAENSGTVRTEGANAAGLFAEAERGGHGQSALVVNSGAIVTTGVRTGATATGGIWAHTGAGARAEARNLRTGSITVEANGVSGLRAVAWDDGVTGATGGEAVGVNHGTIVTKGGFLPIDTDETPGDDDWAGTYGMLAVSSHLAATATNEAGGAITTEGVAAGGMGVFTYNGAVAKGTNRGRIVTKGASGNPLSGGDVGAIGMDIEAYFLSSRDPGGNATALNDISGYIETSGHLAHGMYAKTYNDGARSSAAAVARNRGRVVTKGADADGVVAVASNGGTESNPNIVRAYNDQGASISTEGASAGGLSGLIEADAATAGGTVANAYGSILVRNDGRIATTGGHTSGAGRLDNAYGLAAMFHSTNGSTISSAGDVAAHNTGGIAASGVKARGMQAVTFGSGRATLIVDGGSVAASHDSATDTDDGTGLYASTGASGSIVARVSNGATVTAPQAVLFENAPATLRLTAATLEGRVNFAGLADSLTVNAGIVRGATDFGAGNDTLDVYNGYFTGAIDFGPGGDRMTVHNGGYFGGTVDFGAGTDTLTVVRGAYFKGAITGLTNFTGGGDIYLDNVTFTGSHAEFTSGSRVRLTGDFDLGSGGTMTIRDGARVSVFATRRGGRNSVPTITAGTIRCEGGPCTFFLQNDEQSNADTTAREMVNTMFSPGTRFASGTGRVRYVTQERDGRQRNLGETDLSTGVTQVSGTPAQASPGTPPLPPDTGSAPPDSQMPGAPPPGPQAPGAGGSGDGGGGAAIGVGLATLFSLLLLDFDMFAFDLDEPNEALRPQLAIARSADGGTLYWARGLDAALSPAGSASGVEMGMEVGLAEGFFLGFAVAPDAKVSGSDAFVSGDRYSLRGGWRDESAFAGLSFTRADWNARNAFENPVAGGGLSGAFAAEHTDLRLGAGVRLPLSGDLELMPRLELFAGELEQEGHRARGALFDADIPDIDQRYRGWKAGLDLASDWLEAPEGFRLRPSLSLSAMRIDSDSDSFDMTQSDRFGLLEMTSRVRPADAPRTVFGMGAGMDVVSDDNMKLRLGYVGMTIDGEAAHAAVAGFKLAF